MNRRDLFRTFTVAASGIIVPKLADRFRYRPKRPPEWYLSREGLWVDRETALDMTHRALRYEDRFSFEFWYSYSQGPWVPDGQAIGSEIKRRMALHAQA